MTKISTDMVMTDVMSSLMGIVEDEKLNEVKTVLELHLCRLQIYKEDTAICTQIDCTAEYLAQYLMNMKLNGNTDSSIRSYGLELKSMLAYIDKPIAEIRINDLRGWLANGKINKKWSDRTYNTKLITARCFFNWLYSEDMIEQNPAKKLKETKVERRIGATLTPEQRELVRCSCTDERELAICDLLYTSGVRVSELCGLNRKDIDFVNLKAIVYGKGRKEREVYFTGQTKVHLKKYLETRSDDNEALFVGAQKPYSRLSTGAVRGILKKVKNRDENVKNISLTPHVFRRTLGTDMINRGAPAEMVKEVLGHVQLDTTLQCYAAISKESVKQAHAKYAS